MTKEQVFEKALTIQGWFPIEDMETAWDLVINHVGKGDLVVEVGSWKGRSSYVFASACKEVGAKLICIDSFRGLIQPEHVKWELYHGKDGYYIEGNEGSIVHHIKENLKEFDNVEIWEGDSQQLHKKIKDGSAALIFIDGDHDMPVLGHDLDNYYKKVKIGGYFCGHDYETGNNVSEGVDPRFPKVNLYNTIWGVQRES